METSSPVAIGNRVTMISPTYSRPYCLSFWYHMYGSFMGDLYVKYVNGDIFHVDDILFAKIGDQGDTWHNEKIDISNNCNPYQVSLSFLFDPINYVCVICLIE